MDQVIQSNNSSTVYRTLTSKAVKNYGYSTGVATSNISKSSRKIISDAPVSGSPHGAEVIWTLPRSQLLRNLQIKSTVTFTNLTDTTQAVVSKLGLSLFSSIRIMANNKTILTLSDSYILSRVYNETAEVRNAILSRSYLRNPTTLAGVKLGDSDTGVCYTPIFSSWFEDTIMNLDLGFVETIQVVAQFNSQTALGLPAALVSASCQLVMHNYMPDLKTYQLLKQENFKQNGEKLTMYCYNTYKESMQSDTATDTSTNIKMQLRNIYPDIDTYFYVMASDTNLITKTNRNMFETITSFSLSLGGSTPIIDSMNCLEANYENDLICGCDNTILIPASEAFPVVTSFNSKPIRLPWGLDLTDKITCSGLLSYKNLSSPVLDVTFVSVVGVKYTLYVVHNYSQLVSINPLDSSVSVTVAN